jgi:hypothetical protein
MRSHVRMIPIGVILTAALLFIATTVKSQAPAQAAQVWEYSSVTGMPVTNTSTLSGLTPAWESSATICYATAQGCSRERLAKTVSNQGEGAEALMMATAKLGAEGWELATSTEVLDGNYPKRVLYFRRLKSGSK